MSIVSVHGQELKAMTPDQVRLFAEFNDFVQMQLGYQFVCPRCSVLYGYGKDGVRIVFPEAAGDVAVECSCRRHVVGKL